MSLSLGRYLLYAKSIPLPYLEVFLELTEMPDAKMAKPLAAIDN